MKNEPTRIKDVALTIPPDPDCCTVWPRILHRFDWMNYADQPDMLTMPHLSDPKTGSKWLVNYCPACGLNARNRNVRRSAVDDLRKLL